MARMRSWFAQGLVSSAMVLALAHAACDKIEALPPETSSPKTDSGTYDCSKFSGYKKLCPNDAPAAQTPLAICQDHALHPKCGDLGIKVMECLWGLQTRTDLCGTDGVSIPGKLDDACGAVNAADVDCRARTQ